MDRLSVRCRLALVALALGVPAISSGCAVGTTMGGEDPPDVRGLADRTWPDVDDLLIEGDADEDAMDADEDAMDADDADAATDDAGDADDADDVTIDVSVDAPVVDARCTGACVPGFVQACGRCGVQRCLDDCRWGTCASEGECASGSSRSCGSCGAQTCSSTCTWGACAGGGGCTPGMTRPCGNCGTQTCTAACAWGTCASQGVCAPGAVQRGSCGACSQQVCGATCQWGGCGFRAGANCEYGSGANNRACSACRCGRQWCLPTCVWSTACTSCCTTCGGCQ